GHHLPRERIVLFCLGDSGAMLRDTFEQLLTLSSQLDEVLVGEYNDTVLVLTPPKHRAKIVRLCEELELTAGVSKTHPLEEIVQARSQARSAYRFARVDSSHRHVHEFAAQMAEGVASLLR